MRRNESHLPSSRLGTTDMLITRVGFDARAIGGAIQRTGAGRCRARPARGPRMFPGCSARGRSGREAA